jgi:hypothetical protein
MERRGSRLSRRAFVVGAGIAGLGLLAVTWPASTTWTAGSRVPRPPIRRKSAPQLHQPHPPKIVAPARRFWV